MGAVLQLVKRVYFFDSLSTLFLILAPTHTSGVQCM